MTAETATQVMERRCGCGCGGGVQYVTGRWQALGFIDMVTMRCSGCQCVWSTPENGRTEEASR